MNIYIIACVVFALLATTVNAQTYTSCTNGNVVKGGGICEQDDQCGGVAAGTCLNGTCICNDNYYAKFCDYKARDSYTAGLVGLTLLAGIGGVTALYLGNLTWGITQLILTVVPGIAACVLTRCGIPLGNIMHTLTAAMWLWSFSTTIIYGCRTLDYSACDGNGYPIINNVNGNY